MPSCSENECSREVESNFEQCILHCEKGDYGTDFARAGFLNRFYKALADEIAQHVSEFSAGEGFQKHEVLTYLINPGSGDNSRLREAIKQTTIVFTRIHFPDRDGRDVFDYQKTLRNLGAIHFNYCVFSVHSYSFKDVRCFFQDCTFKQAWYLPCLPILGNQNHVIYQNCEFRENVSGFGEDGGRLELKENQFRNCVFEKELALYSTDFSGCLFKNSEDSTTELQKFVIEGCQFDAKFLANSLRVDRLSIRNTEFVEKAELKRSDISTIEILNSNFSQILDAHGTKFGQFRSERCIFNDFVGFEGCEFGVTQLDGAAVFEYVTFREFVNFRKSKFCRGLNVENANFRVPPNFLKAYVEPDGTSRETFRIIKYSFDCVGNQIEGNRYFADEMRKYKQELSNEPWSQEKLVFFLNGTISNFGQSYLRPLLWIIFFSLVYLTLIKGYENNWLYSIYPKANAWIAATTGFFNNVAKAFLPFERLLKEGMELVSLVFYVVFASLVWQTIIAVKRHTRR